MKGVWDRKGRNTQQAVEGGGGQELKCPNQATANIRHAAPTESKQKKHSDQNAWTEFRNTSLRGGVQTTALERAAAGTGAGKSTCD